MHTIPRHPPYNEDGMANPENQRHTANMFNQHLLQHKMTSCTTCQLGRAFHGQSFNYSNQAKPKRKN